jgi:2-iminoacetate synthase ThiH
MIFERVRSAQIRRRGGSWVGYSPPLFQTNRPPHTTTTMKALLILSIAALTLSSCSWTKSDWQRLAEATGKAALSAGAVEAQAIQIDRTSGK